MKSLDQLPPPGPTAAHLHRHILLDKLFGTVGIYRRCQQNGAVDIDAQYRGAHRADEVESLLKCFQFKRICIVRVAPARNVYAPLHVLHKMGCFVSHDKRQGFHGRQLQLGGGSACLRHVEDE